MIAVDEAALCAIEASTKLHQIMREYGWHQNTSTSRVAERLDVLVGFFSNPDMNIDLPARVRLCNTVIENLRGLIQLEDKKSTPELRMRVGEKVEPENFKKQLIEQAKTFLAIQDKMLRLHSAPPSPPASGLVGPRR